MESVIRLEVRRRQSLGMCRVNNLELPGLCRGYQGPRRRFAQIVGVFVLIGENGRRIRMGERMQNLDLPEVLLRGRNGPSVMMMTVPLAALFGAFDRF